MRLTVLHLLPIAGIPVGPICMIVITNNVADSVTFLPDPDPDTQILSAKIGSGSGPA